MHCQILTKRITSSKQNTAVKFSTLKEDSNNTRVLCGTTYRAEFAGERIPTLREAVDLCEELDLLMFLDIKGDSQKVEEPVKVSLRELVQSQSSET